MKDSKPWWLSKGVIGGIIAMVAGILGLTTADTLELQTAAIAIATEIGGIIAIYGRWVANKKVTLTLT